VIFTKTLRFAQRDEGKQHFPDLLAHRAKRVRNAARTKDAGGLTLQGADEGDTQWVRDTGSPSW
jgi:hypothetical protein